MKKIKRAARQDKERQRCVATESSNTLLRVKTERLGVRILLPMLFAAVTLPAVCAATDLQTRHEFKIPAQSLDTALLAFSGQAKVQVLMWANQPEAKSPGVNGTLSGLAALKALLGNTGLQFKQIDEETVAIVASADTSAPIGGAFPPAARGSAAGSTQPLRLVQAEGKDSSATSDSSNKNESAGPEGTATGKIELEEVTVTASRAVRGGYQAPTPTTVIGGEEFKNSGLSNVADMLNTQLPSLRGTLTPASQVRTSSGGGNYLDLRGLGAPRTLVLVDNRRHVPTGVREIVNVNVIPQALIERVEVVTGGASAAWGSDAVAGVVNLILKDHLDGFQSEIRYGATGHQDNDGHNLSLAFGSPFADDRGQFMIAGEWGKNHGVSELSDRDWGREGWQLINNPAFAPGNGQPRRLVARDVHAGNGTRGGLIVAPASLVGPNPFLGRIEFGPGGVPIPFVPGSVTGPDAQVGGSGYNAGGFDTVVIPEEHVNVYSRATFDFNDHLSGFTDLSFAQSSSEFFVLPTFDLGASGGINIKRDNAFLPAAVASQLDTLGLTQFRLGRINNDFGFLNPRNKDTTMRGVVGLKGSVHDWEWDTYYQYGKNRSKQAVANDRIAAFFNASVDSIIDPLTGVPICRNTPVGSPTCVPVNLFGEGSPSAAAIDYFSEDSHWWIDTVQNVVAVNLRGVPVSTWAGPVSVAAGGEYREEKVDFNSDRISAGELPVPSANGGFFTHNAKPYTGDIRVGEAYVEAIAPVLRDLPLANSLTLNGAFRATHYSTSGSVNTWKVGSVYEPIVGLRLRATLSRDIRAPNPFELFSRGNRGFVTVFDARTGANVPNVEVTTGGNGDLNPEEATTKTFGVVVEPSWLPGFQASVDYYDVDIQDAIGTIPNASIVTRCEAGSASFCALVTRNDTGALTALSAFSVNIARLRTSGEDIDLGYRFDASSITKSLPGDVSLRFLATHIEKLVSTSEGVSIDAVGSLGAAGGVPEWRGSASATWEAGPASFYLASRYVGSGKYDTAFGPLDIDNNEVKSAFYLDATVRYTLMGNYERTMTLSGSIRNLLDKDPPVVPGNDFSSPPTNPVFYDMVGRYYSVGLSLKY
jgi:iron complex outermembrane recepter protein